MDVPQARSPTRFRSYLTFESTFSRSSMARNGTDYTVWSLLPMHTELELDMLIIIIFLIADRARPRAPPKGLAPRDLPVTQA